MKADVFGRFDDATGLLVALQHADADQTELLIASLGGGGLSATGVTPGTYTAPTITVDVAGRVTAAASGAAATVDAFTYSQGGL